MNNNLAYSLLAMDSYNRGCNESIHSHHLSL